MSTVQVDYPCQGRVKLNEGCFWMRKTQQTCKLTLVSKHTWECLQSTTDPTMIFDLGTIVEVLNAHTPPIDLGQDGAAIKDRMTNACKKHNERPIQYLKYLIIPWIVCKIFGWTCMTSYALPNFHVQVKSPEQTEPKAVPQTEPTTTKKEEETSSTIDLSGQKLQEIPAEVLKRKDLKVLILDNNALSALPAELAELTQLEKLVLSHNAFTEVPDVIFTLKNLKELSFHGIEHMVLSEETAKKFADLPLLTEVDFGYCNHLIPGRATLERMGRKHAVEQALLKALPKCNFTF